MFISQICAYATMDATIILTGITCRKSLVICATQLAGGLLLKMLKYFKIFGFSCMKETVLLIGLHK